MDPKPDQTRHASHTLRGPHFRRRLTPEERSEINRWLEASQNESGVNVRELALFVSRFPVLERAVHGAAGSALWAGRKPSSTTHAVAMLGIRRTLQMIRSLSGASKPSAPA